MKFYVYIVRCIDNTYYTGYSTNVEDRILKHNSGKGAKYTKYRRPVCLKYKEEFNDKSSALKRECFIKKLSRKEKENLIESYEDFTKRPT